MRRAHSQYDSMKAMKGSDSAMKGLLDLSQVYLGYDQLAIVRPASVLTVLMKVMSQKKDASFAWAWVQFSSVQRGLG